MGIEYGCRNMRAGSVMPDGAAIGAKLEAFALEFDGHLREFLAARSDEPGRLWEAIRYSALAPGKRVRPYLATRCCELCGGNRDSSWPIGAAVECAHAFSLIHDDLPAMDDDDFRRGQPSSHKKFGEALAILAGDALMVMSFELIGRHPADPARISKMVLELACGVGCGGMIGGQAADILGETQLPSLEMTEYIHERKTARLFGSACRLGAICAGAIDADVEAVGRFGKALGRAFQIADDLLDASAADAALEKGIGKDAPAGKQTFPRSVGVEESRNAARQAAKEAAAHLKDFGGEADDLRMLVAYVVDRNY